MAGERARPFSELPSEFDGEPAPARQHRLTTYTADDEEGEEETPGRPNAKAKPRALRKPIRMMAGREKCDFVGAFHDSPITGLKWGSFFNLAPSVKRDICYQLVQERTRNKGQGKGNGKTVTIDEVPDEQEVSAVVTDRNLGDMINFYLKGIVTTEKGEFRVLRILVDAGSVVNLMPIHPLEYTCAKLRKAEGMVIRTATNALAKLAYYADIRITIANVEWDLRVYAVPREFKPTYPLLLSRHWLQAVKAKGDYSTGQYYIMNMSGFRVRIPRDRKATLSHQRHHPRVPLVMKDKNTKKRELSTETEKELEYQHPAGENFFNDFVRKIIRQACEEMRREDEEEAEGGGSSEESEN